MTDLPLTKLAETATTITLGWEPPLFCRGYGFYAGTKFSHTMDGTRTSVRFAKGASVYRVLAFGVTAEGVYPPPVVIPPPPSGKPPFGSRPDAPSRNYNGGTDIEITGKTIRQALATGGTGQHSLSFMGVRDTTVNLVDCDLVGPSSGLYFQGCHNVILNIVGCRAKDLGWNLAQFNDCHQMSGRIAGNETLGGKHEDILSIFKSSGVGWDKPWVVEGNRFEGVDWTSGSGTGSLLGEYHDPGSGLYLIYRDNTLLNPGQVGVGIRGPKVKLLGNRIVKEASFRRGGSGDVGVYVWADPAYPADDVEVSGNKVMWFKADGVSRNPYWNAGNVTNLRESGNTWDWWATGFEVDQMRVAL